MNRTRLPESTCICIVNGVIETYVSVAEIQTFLQQSVRPALIEPGEPLLVLDPDCYSLEQRGANVILQAWDTDRNIVRRVRSIDRRERGKLSLTVERFARRTGELQLVDLAHQAAADWERRSSRTVFRERFRRMLLREFPTWTIEGLTTEPDLEHTLSPAYPRAVLVQGTTRAAVIAAPPDSRDFPSLITFGLIWLAYLRIRETTGSLVFWVPAEAAHQVSAYLPHLDPAAARIAMYLYTNHDFVQLVDPQNYGNISTRLSPANSAAPHDSSSPEAQLEAILRADVSLIDASLSTQHVYGQVSATAGHTRGIIDLLTVDYTGRLCLLELKASQDVHLPLQALDYWLRVKWHLERGEFPTSGYFPGIQLRSDPPRLILIAPAFDFHPTTETVLRFFAPHIDITRIGLSADWRENPRIMFRLRGSESPL